MLCPTGKVLLMMRLLQLASKWLEFCRAALTIGGRILVLLVAYLLRRNLGDSNQLRQPVPRLSPIPFLGGEFTAQVG